MINLIQNKILAGERIVKDEAVYISEIPQKDILSLLTSANIIREHFRCDFIDLCAIINAKSGACPEDCSYCAQSSKSFSKTSVYPLLKKNTVIEKAMEAKDKGVKRFCIVTSGRKPNGKEIREIASMISEVRSIGLLPCATLGLLNKDELLLLKDNGLERYHHNIETSERFFSEICGTHTYSDKLKTIEAVQSAGLSLCSGGIFGMGETWDDRIDMAFALRELNVDSVPINFLIPVKGTLLGNRDLMDPFEALRIISLYRIILPEKEVRVCGGRVQVLREFNSMVFTAGADSILTGNYLTTTGRTFDDDIKMIYQHGLRVS